MAFKSSSSKQKLFSLFLFFFCAAILLLTATYNFKPCLNDLCQLKNELPKGTLQNPIWYDTIAEEVKGRMIKIGVINMADDEVEEKYYLLYNLGETVSLGFDHVAEDLQWKDFFHGSIHEDENQSRPSCPEIPMPKFEDYGEVDMVVATVPCGNGVETEGIRDVFRLQVNLVVANLAVSGWMEHDIDRTVYVVFIGSCGPMLEIFRCDDLLSHEGDYWVYRPDLRKLKQKVLMPVGICQLAPPYAEPGKEYLETLMSQSTLSKPNTILHQPREAYVTILHSSKAYVCGAIALAQSIIQTNSTKDLVVLVDDSITTRSLQGLRDAGWKIKVIERIRCPQAEKGAYNEWNYSKLRLWQLVEYDKIIFIDADFLILENIDRFFVYPQLSAVWNSRVVFNSGIMLVEPSECMFETLMAKSNTLVSYNGGDQGFLNEVFTWWHRWPKRLNHFKGLKRFRKTEYEIPEDIYAIHYFGMKPWLCYRDYDCNWDFLNQRPYASDSAHWRWWQTYDAMSKTLHPYCALTDAMDAWLKELRGRAQAARFPDEHWKIEVTDPRQHY